MQLIALFSMQLIALFSLQLIALFSLQLKRVFSCHVIAPSTFIRLPIVVTTTNNAPQRQSPKIIVVPLHRKKVTSLLRYIFTTEDNIKSAQAVDEICTEDMGSSTILQAVTLLILGCTRQSIQASLMLCSKLYLPMQKWEKMLWRTSEGVMMPPVMEARASRH